MQPANPPLPAKSRRLLRFGICVGVALALGIATVSAGPVTNAMVRNLEGQEIDPFADNPSVTVFVFITPECPISNRYIPTLRKLVKEYEGKVPFWFVHVDTNASPAALRGHRDDYRLPETVVVDRHHALVEKACARVTPEAAIFGRDQQLLYHGRIDNRYLAPGKARPRATTHDLKTNLDAVLAGKAIPTTPTPAVGCVIPRWP